MWLHIFDKLVQAVHSLVTPSSRVPPLLCIVSADKQTFQHHHPPHTMVNIPAPPMDEVCGIICAVLHCTAPSNDCTW